MLDEGSPLGSVGGDALVSRAVVEALSFLIDLDPGRPPLTTAEAPRTATMASVAAEESRASQVM